MTTIVQGLADFGAVWLDWLFERSVVCAVALGVVFAVILLLRGRTSAHVPSLLLLLPLLLLFVPIERALPGRWPSPLPASVRVATRTEAATTVAPPVAPASAADRFGPELARADQIAPPPAGSAPSLPALAFAAWALFVAAGALRLFGRQRRADRALWRSSQAPDPELQRTFARLCRRGGLRRPAALRISPHLASPVTTGIRRPAVFLPAAISDTLTPQQLRFVLLHEIAHVRRCDVAVEALVRIACLGWFFHPGVWLARAALARWREYACDEAALAHDRSRARVPLADILLHLIHRVDAGHRPAGAFAQHLTTMMFLRTRLTRILDRTRTPRRGLTPASLLALTTSGLMALTAARAQQEAPTRSADVAVDVALAQGTTWLLRNQEADGRWAIHSEPDRSYQRDHNEVHVTALAVRALLPELKTERRPQVAAAIRRGVTYLASTQGDDGRFGPDDPNTSMYGHAAALLALCQVEEALPDDARLECIQRAVHYAEAARNPYQGWRYAPRSGDNDSKITGLMLLALRAAAGLGIAVDPAAFAGGNQCLDQLTNAATGRTGFVATGSTMSRFTSKRAEFPGVFSEEPTAIALLVRQAAPKEAESAQVTRRAVDLLVATPPEWSRERGSIDYAYWCFGAAALAGVGGEPAEVWRGKLRAALVDNRVVERDAAHWPAVDAWSHPGMEAYATASALLALSALR